MLKTGDTFEAASAVLKRLREAIETNPQIEALRTRIKSSGISLSITKATTPKEYLAVVDILRKRKAQQTDIEQTFVDIKRESHGIHKLICSQEKTELQPIQRDITEAERLIVEYDDERAKIAEAASKNEQALAIEDDAARREAEAAFCEEQGVETGRSDLIDRAEAIRLTPGHMPATYVPKDTPKVAGLTINAKATATCVDLNAFILGAVRPVVWREVAKELRAASKQAKGALRNVLAEIAGQFEEKAAVSPSIPLDLFEVRETTLNGLARSMTATVAQWPGIEMGEKKKPRMTAAATIKGDF